MKITLLLILTAITSFPSLAQVGFGETHPTAALEIKTTASDLPGLRLNPQKNPKGVDTGQMAVIDDKLYMFDADRGVWLSVEYTTFEFGRLGSGSDPNEVEFGGGDLQSGPRLPFDATIVSISMRATDNDNRSISLTKNGVAVPNNDVDPSVDGVLYLNPTTFIYENLNYNLELDAGDQFSFTTDDLSNDIKNLTITVMVKWRKENP